jgi:hypothetical protein
MFQTSRSQVPIGVTASDLLLSRVYAVAKHSAGGRIQKDARAATQWSLNVQALC